MIVLSDLAGEGGDEEGGGCYYYIGVQSNNLTCVPYRIIIMTGKVSRR